MVLIAERIIDNFYIKRINLSARIQNSLIQTTNQQLVSDVLSPLINPDTGDLVTGFLITPQRIMDMSVPELDTDVSTARGKKPTGVNMIKRRWLRVDVGFEGRFYGQVLQAEHRLLQELVLVISCSCRWMMIKTTGNVMLACPGGRPCREKYEQALGLCFSFETWST